MMTPEEQEYIKSIAVVAAAAGVLGGAVVSAITILINGWRQRVADEKRDRSDAEAATVRHFRELALEAAVADWKQHLEAAEKWTPETFQGENDRPEVDPFDFFLIKKLKMIQTFGDGSISGENLPFKFEAMREFYQFFHPKRSSSKSTKTTQ